MRPSAEEIAWLGLWPAAAVLAVCLLLIAPPLSDLYPGPTYQLFPEWRSAVNPEPLEATRFLFVLAAPFALAAAVLLGSPASPRRRFDPWAVALQLAALGLIAWGVVEQDTGPFPLFGSDYFKPLLRQGASASGGAKEYVDADGRMTGGFALIAWPAEYGTTGVMSFIVSQDGVVFERDLGETTSQVAEQTAEFDPGAGWVALVPDGEAPVP